MTLLLEHIETGRNPTVLIGLAASALLAFTADVATLPVLVWATWLPCTLALIYIFLANPVCGSRIANGYWVCFTTDGRCAIPLSLVDHVQLTEWRDRSVTVRIHLGDGRVFSLPSDCLPRADHLKRALQQAEVAVRTG